MSGSSRRFGSTGELLLEQPHKAAIVMAARISFIKNDLPKRTALLKSKIAFTDFKGVGKIVKLAFFISKATNDRQLSHIIQIFVKGRATIQNFRFAVGLINPKAIHRVALTVPPAIRGMVIFIDLAFKSKAEVVVTVIATHIINQVRYRRIFAANVHDSRISTVDRIKPHRLNATSRRSLRINKTFPTVILKGTNKVSLFKGLLHANITIIHTACIDIFLRYTSLENFKRIGQGFTRRRYLFT